MGSEARARLGLAALLAVTLISFSMLFRQGDYPGPILLGMLIAGGLVILLRRAGAGIPASLLASLGALYWYLSLVFQAPHTFYGLPTLATGRGMLDSIWFAYDKSYIDFAPVSVRPGYVILVIAVMWLAATVGEIATFRLRRPLLASFIPMSLFVFLLIVGTREGAQFFVVVFVAALLTYWGLESAHRLRSWGRWMSTWSHLKPDAPTSIAGNIARKMGASCLAAAVIAPVFLPLLGSGGITWRNGSGNGPGTGAGSGTGGSVDLLASITPQEIRQTSSTLFTVDAEDATYWRLASLSRFDGTTWRAAVADTRPVEDGQIQTTLPATEESEPVRQVFHIEELEGTHLPAAVQPIDIEYARSSELSVDPESGDIQRNAGLAPGMTYTVTSAMSTATFDQLSKAATGDPGTVYDDLPRRPSDAVIELRDSWIEDADTPFERLTAIQDHLRGPEFEYSLDVQPGTSTDYLETFLTETRRGYCQQFATAFAVLARSLGYPTRVSIGFLRGTQSSTSPNHSVVRGTDTHAWPEVYFEKYGWIAFEPTPRGLAPPPSYTSPRASSPGQLAEGRGGRNGGPAGGHKFANEPLQDPFLRGDRITDPGAGDGGPRDASPAWQPAFTRLLLILLAIVALWLGSVPALKVLRVRTRYRNATTPRDHVAAAFAEFQDEAAELASRRRPAESGAAFVERIAGLGVVSRSAATRLGRLYDAAEYSTQEVLAEQAEEARRLARQLKASMWRAASIGRKTARLFSARELLAQRRPGRLLRRLRPAAASGLTSRV